MHQLRSLRRMALGASLAGALIGAVPALASAAGPTCLYNPTTKRVTVDDPGVGGILRVLQSGDNIAITDHIGPEQICTNQVDFFTVAATVSNTDLIVINSKNVGQARGIVLEQLGPGATPESDGVSEIETLINTTNPRVFLQLLGSNGPDGIRIGATGINFGLDAFATDNDIDIQTTTAPVSITVYGSAGDDAISGRGNFANPQPTSVRLILNGEKGNDFVEGGLGQDQLYGGSGDDPTGNDRLVSNDGQPDVLDGGPGFDTATTDANEKSVSGIEVRTVESVGRLRLAPQAVRARAGQVARLTLGWKHPQSWRQLRTLKLSLHRGKDTVATVDARLAGGRLTGSGAIDLMPGSRLDHHGKWVTAKLALRMPKSLAGVDLRVDVQATDRHGHKQLEPDAGTIRVLK